MAAIDLRLNVIEKSNSDLYSLMHTIPADLAQTKEQIIKEISDRYDAESKMPEAEENKDGER